MRLVEVYEAVEALEFLEEVAVGKARPRRSIWTDEGFLRAILRLARGLQEKANAPLGSRKFRDGVLRASSIDWLGASADDRKRAVGELEHLIRGLPSRFAPGVRVELESEAKRVLTEGHKELAARHPKAIAVDPSFALKNETAVESLSTSSSVFFADEYERRAERFRERAHEAISKGLDKGLGRGEIARSLRSEFGEAVATEAYWETTASVHVARARSFSAAKTYAEAGVEEFEVIAIVDSRTTPLCAALNGMKFSVKKALDHFDDLEGAKTLEQVKRKLSPFGRVRDSGEVELSSGKLLSPRATPAEFQAAGLHAPPFHYRCRSSVAPVL